MFFMLLFIWALCPQNVYNQYFQYPDLFSYNDNDPRRVVYPGHPFFTQFQDNHYSTSKGKVSHSGVTVEWNTTNLNGDVPRTDVIVKRERRRSYTFSFRSYMPQNMDVVEWVRKNSNRYGNKKYITDEKGEGSSEFVTRPKLERLKKKLEMKNLLPADCGQAAKDLNGDRIIDGKEIEIKKCPWQVALLWVDENTLLCGGSLITDTHVLTAGHCLFYTKSDKKFEKRDLYISVGTTFRKDMKRKSSNSFSLKDVYIHPLYKPMVTKKHDIALLKLQIPVLFSTNAKPVCLPPPRTKYNSNKKCRVSGWGQTNPKIERGSQQLRVAVVSLVQHEVCEACYKDFENITDGMVCAGNLFQGGADTCQGDSGGPLVCHIESETFTPCYTGYPGKVLFTTIPYCYLQYGSSMLLIADDEKHYLFGTTSFGVDCGAKHRPGVYVRVVAYRPWILHTIRKSTEPPGAISLP